MKHPKVLVCDIETTPNLACCWGTNKQFISYESILKERVISCICYKWMDKAKVYSLKMDMKLHDLSKYDEESDKKMLIEFMKVYNQADLVVAHNGVHFDIGVINSRLIKHRLPPINLVVIDDTYVKTKSINFNSHKLDYLGQYLNVGHKASHPYSLWVKVMQGDKKALEDTIKYCKQDVLLLDRVYKELLPYIKSNLNRAVFSGDKLSCISPNCDGSVMKYGTRITVNLGKQQRYKCVKCGKMTKTAIERVENSKEYPR